MTGFKYWIYQSYTYIVEKSFSGHNKEYALQFSQVRFTKAWLTNLKNAKVSKNK